MSENYQLNSSNIKKIIKQTGKSGKTAGNCTSGATVTSDYNDENSTCGGCYISFKLFFLLKYANIMLIYV